MWVFRGKFDEAYQAMDGSRNNGLIISLALE